MTRGTVADCSERAVGAWSGGHLVFVDVLIARCRTTNGDTFSADTDGGGILIRASTLTMSGGAIRDCKATDGFGGALKIDAEAQVSLSNVIVYGCEADKVGGIYVSKGAQLSLVDVSIEECSSAHTGYAGGLDSAGFLHAERVRVVRCNLLRPMSGGVITVWGSSTWTDCIVADNHGAIWCATGMHTFTRITVLRTSALQNPEWGSIGISAGTTTMIDSRVADAGSPCVIATETGTLVLRNTTLSNCSAPRRDLIPAFVSRTYLAMSDEAATNFQSELLTLEPSCEEDPSAALIGVDSAFTAPLNARGLRVVAPATCASTKFAVFRCDVRSSAW